MYEICHESSSRLPKFKTTEKFHGKCLETGAQKSVIVRLQAKSYCRLLGLKFKKAYNMNSFKFGDGIFRSMARIPIRIPTPDSGFLGLNVDVVETNIPFLLGVVVMDKYEIIPDNVNNLLIRNVMDGACSSFANIPIYM